MHRKRPPSPAIARAMAHPRRRGRRARRSAASRCLNPSQRSARRRPRCSSRTARHADGARRSMRRQAWSTLARCCPASSWRAAQCADVLQHYRVLVSSRARGARASGGRTSVGGQVGCVAHRILCAADCNPGWHGRAQPTSSASLLSYSSRAVGDPRPGNGCALANGRCIEGVRFLVCFRLWSMSPYRAALFAVPR